MFIAHHHHCTRSALLWICLRLYAHIQDFSENLQCVLCPQAYGVINLEVTDADFTNNTADFTVSDISTMPLRLALA